MTTPAPTHAATTAASTSTPSAASAAAAPSATSTDPTLPPQRLATSVLLHLLPGVALLAFVILAAPTLRSLGVPTAFALFIGIPLVIVPMELGYLLLYAKRTTGSWALRGALGYDRKLPTRKLVKLSGALFAWFFVFFVVSTVFVDEWLASTAFAWLPDAVLQFSTFDDPGGPTPGPLLTIGLLLVAVVFNGVVGPVVEELYFRGHLLPRLERYGRWAPVMNTVLFSLYHLWTPWQNPARIIGFLPIAWSARRHRSVQLPMAAHVTINLVFLLLMISAILAGAA